MSGGELSISQTSDEKQYRGCPVRIGFHFPSNTLTVSLSILPVTTSIFPSWLTSPESSRQAPGPLRITGPGREPAAPIAEHYAHAIASDSNHIHLTIAIHVCDDCMKDVTTKIEW